MWTWRGKLVLGIPKPLDKLSPRTRIEQEKGPNRHGTIYGGNLATPASLREGVKLTKRPLQPFSSGDSQTRFKNQGRGGESVLVRIIMPFQIREKN